MGLTQVQQYFTLACLDYEGLCNQSNSDCSSKSGHIASWTEGETPSNPYG